MFQQLAPEVKFAERVALSLSIPLEDKYVDASKIRSSVLTKVIAATKDDRIVLATEEAPVITKIISENTDEIYDAEHAITVEMAAMKYVSIKQRRNNLINILLENRSSIAFPMPIDGSELYRMRIYQGSPNSTTTSKDGLDYSSASWSVDADSVLAFLITHMPLSEVYKQKMWHAFFWQPMPSEIYRSSRYGQVSQPIFAGFAMGVWISLWKSLLFNCSDEYIKDMKGCSKLLSYAIDTLAVVPNKYPALLFCRNLSKHVHDQNLIYSKDFWNYLRDVFPNDSARQVAVIRNVIVTGADFSPKSNEYVTLLHLLQLEPEHQIYKALSVFISTAIWKGEYLSLHRYVNHMSRLAVPFAVDQGAIDQYNRDETLRIAAERDARDEIAARTTDTSAPVASAVATPVATSVTASVTASVATSVAAPVSTSVSASVATPVSAAVSASVAAPVAAPVNASVTAPVAAPVSAPIAADTSAISAPVDSAVKTDVSTPVGTDINPAITERPVAQLMPMILLPEKKRPPIAYPLNPNDESIVSLFQEVAVIDSNGRSLRVTSRSDTQVLEFESIFANFKPRQLNPNSQRERFRIFTVLLLGAEKCVDVYCDEFMSARELITQTNLSQLNADEYGIVRQIASMVLPDNTTWINIAEKMFDGTCLGVLDTNGTIYTTATRALFDLNKYIREDAKHTEGRGSTISKANVQMIVSIFQLIIEMLCIFDPCYPQLWIARAISRPNDTWRLLKKTDTMLEEFRKKYSPDIVTSGEWSGRSLPTWVRTLSIAACR